MVEGSARQGSALLGRTLRAFPQRLRGADTDASLTPDARAYCAQCRARTNLTLQPLSRSLPLRGIWMCRRCVQKKYY